MKSKKTPITGKEKVSAALKAGKKVSKNSFKSIKNIRATISGLRSKGMKISSEVVKGITYYSIKKSKK